MRFGKRKPIAETGKNLALENQSAEIVNIFAIGNVDFLLDLQSAEIVNIFAIRSPERLENRIAKWLERDPRTDIIERGLGANDAPGATHLLRLGADDMRWMSLTDNAMAVLGENTLNQMNNIEN